MADDPIVEIRELVLRLPGLALDRHDADRLGRQVARHLLENLPDWRMLRPSDTSNIRIRIPANARRDELAKIIAAQIARALQ